MMKIISIFIILLLLGCNISKNNNSLSFTDSISTVNIPEVVISVDTSSIVKKITKMYLFIQENKISATIKTDNNRVENIDTSTIEYSGDFSITETWDTTYTISDSLFLFIFNRKEENQMGNFYSRCESYYKGGELFFKFSMEIKETPSTTNNSGISETRTYFYEGKPIRCLFRELIIDDIDNGKDSILKIPSGNCK